MDKYLTFNRVREVQIVRRYFDLCNYVGLIKLIILLEPHITLIVAISLDLDRFGNVTVWGGVDAASLWYAPRRELVVVWIAKCLFWFGQRS